MPSSAPNGSDVTAEFDRDPTQVGGYTATYTISQAIQPSKVSYLTASFYTAAGAQGTLVGTAAAPATVSGTTVQFGSITLQGIIKTVQIEQPNPAIDINSSATQLNFSALDANGVTVAVTPGSAIWSVQSGAAFLSLTKDGIATPVSAGTAMITATVDGIASTSTSLIISPPRPRVTIFSILGNDLAFDATRNLVYVATAATDSRYPSEIVPIDVATGTAGTPFPCGGTPICVGVTSDDSELYAGHADGTVTRVSLSSHSVDLSFSVPSTLEPIQILTIPNSPGSVAINSAPAQFTLENDVCAIYDGGTPRASTADLGYTLYVSPDGSKISGVDSYSPTTCSIDTIGNNGLTTLARSYLGLGIGGHICQANNVLVVAGYVEMALLNPNTGATLSSSGSDAVERLVCSDNSSSRFYLGYYGVNSSNVMIQAYDSSTGSAVGSVLSTGINDAYSEEDQGTMISCGPNKVAFRNYGYTGQIALITNLP